jgi:hypothetical protein
MADFQAIGAVSATLRLLLEDRMELPDVHGTVSVTISTPREEDAQNNGNSRVNLFLYRVTENGNLKNQEIPGRGPVGSYGHPPLSLDLHYLLTAYGATAAMENDTDERPAHYLLGSAMRVLHAYPVITRGVRTIREPAGEQILDQSLQDEFERVKLYLDPLSLDDLSKVWQTLMLSYQLSVAYKVTVVQIENPRPRSFPQPVGEPPAGGPRIHAVPFRFPEIRELRVRRGGPSGTERPFPYARVGDTLVIHGRNFGLEPANVLLGAVEIPVTPRGDDRIELSIPDDTLPGGAAITEERRLQPGAQPVSVVLGVPGLPGTGFRSNQAVFMLVPLVRNLVPSGPPRTLGVEGERLLAGTLSGETLVGPLVFDKSSYGNPSATGITVPLPDTLPARRVRCLVSGDLSPFPANLPDSPQVQVKIGAGTPRTATLQDKPNDLQEAAVLLQAAIREVPGGDPGFEGARVTTAGNRLLVVPGNLFADPVTFSGADADTLMLSTGNLYTGAYLSGELVTFPPLTAASPSLKVAIGNAPNPPTHTVSLASRPTSVAQTAGELQGAITQAAGPNETGFSAARVAVLERQLLVLPGVRGEGVDFEGVPVGDATAPDGDETTVAELRLRVRYPVRVRVNNAESIDDAGLEMPP